MFSADGKFVLETLRLARQLAEDILIDVPTDSSEATAALRERAHRLVNQARLAEAKMRVFDPDLGKKTRRGA